MRSQRHLCIRDWNVQLFSSFSLNLKQLWQHNLISCVNNSIENTMSAKWAARFFYLSNMDHTNPIFATESISYVKIFIGRLWLTAGTDTKPHLLENGSRYVDKLVCFVHGLLMFVQKSIERKTTPMVTYLDVYQNILFQNPSIKQKAFLLSE